WLILVSAQPLSAAKSYYGERWGIEVFFAACKTRGFNFEDTHVTKLKRIYNLLFVVAIAFIWAIKTGEYLVKNGYKIPIKKLKKRKAKLYSIFRVGFDYLQEQLLNFLSIQDKIRLLSCT
ncbi:MAG: transposase, partial [Saprospiraceae bacterium]|nr:transposase [Saprospiraceae bacterium]